MSLSEVYKNVLNNYETNNGSGEHCVGLIVCFILLYLEHSFDI